MALSEAMKKRIQNAAESQKTGSANGAAAGGSQNTGLSSAMKDRIRKAASMQQLGKEDPGVDEAFLKKFQNDYQKYVYDTQHARNTMTYQSSRDGSYEKRFGAVEKDLADRAKTIRTYLNLYQDSLDSETYKNLTDYMDQVDSVGSDIRKGYSSLRDYFSQWETEDDYNAYVARQKDYDEKAGYDVAAGRQEIEALEKQLADLRLQQTAASFGPRANRDNGAAQYAEQIRQLEQEIARKKQYANQSQYIQKGETMKGVTGNQDFGANSGYVSTIDENPAWGMSGVGDNLYEWINNRNGFRNTYERDMARLNTMAGGQKTESPYYQKGYDRMTDQEVAIYNYYYATEGKEKAEEYLHSIQEQLNTRKATELFEGMQGKTGQELVFGVEAGLDQFQSGMQSLINTKDDYIAQSTKQIASGMVREDLEDDSIPMWYNFKTGQWEQQILGSSAGQLAYDAITTSANMAPSILTSIAVGMINPVAGQIAGSALMGASAAGSAYQEKLNAGYDKNQARSYGILVGASEIVMEKVLGGITKLGGGMISRSILKNLSAVDNVLARFAKSMGGQILMGAGSEALEEGVQSVLEPFILQAVTGEEASIDWQEAMYSALLGFATGGMFEGADVVYNTGVQNREAKKEYGGQQQEIVKKALELDKENAFAQKMQGRLNRGSDLTGGQLNRLVEQNKAAMTAQDKAAIQKAAAQRLTELGETENVEAVAAALTKQVAGEELSLREHVQLRESKYGQRVANELNPENIRSGKYASGWAENLNTNRINPEEYGRMVETAQQPQAATETKPVETVTQAAKPAKAAKTEPVATVQENRTVAKSATTAEESSTVESKPATLEEAAQKYGAQAGAMMRTYNAGQDVEQFDRAYQLAYDMGRSGVNLDYAMKSEALQYLTEDQREIAYNTGRDAASTKAAAKDAANRDAANGKTGRKQGGVVRGEGVTTTDLKKAFNDTRGKAYKSLSTIAKATGINIVLYKSQTDAEGNFVGEQGKFDPNKPNEIWIDINAGLQNVNDVNQLQKYVLLRTFSHEFTHFIEKWNPIRYNEFRRAVFETMTKQGLDVNDLIETRMNKDGLDYEAASREVVADAMADVLPDANFVQMLAEKHQTVFQKLREKLKEFAQNIKEYFDSVGWENNPAAEGLKEQGKYLDSIVKLWDEIAVQAVETYQQTVATDEVVVSKKESTAPVEVATEETQATSEEKQATTEEITAEVEETAPVVEKDPYGFTITDNAEHGSLEIKFDSKPSAEVIHALKENKFRWHKVKKLWFGFADRETITNALHTAYEADNAQEAEPVQVTAKDQYDGISDALQNANVFYNGGLEFKVEMVGGAGYNATIKRKSDGYVTNARNTLFSSMFATRAEAVSDLVEVARNNKLLGNSQAAENTKEVMSNGKESENGPDTAAVPEPVRGSQGPARLLEGVEPEPVRGSSEGRQPVQSGSDQGAGDAGRDGQPDAAGPVPARSTGDRLAGDLQQLQSVTEDVTDNNVGDKTSPTAEDTNVPGKAEEIQPVSSDPVQMQEIVEELTEQRSTENPKGGNFVIGDSLNLPSGTKARVRANIDAIKLVKQIAAEDRIATPAEQEVLSKYVGWGGLPDAFGKPFSNTKTRKIEYEAVKGLEAEFEELKTVLTEEEYKSARESTQNAHYTSIEVIKAMYDGLKQLGFTGGRMLEPSSGVGNFVGAMPSDMTAQVKSWTMVELDNITGLFAKYLYPNADVRIQGFENANIPDGYMDVAIGNVPFGNYAIADKHYPKTVTSAIHNYFFAKSLDKVRTGGIVMFITSSYTMNGRDNAVRKYIMQRADLLGAIRLPNTAFAGNAGTSVVTDILILKKRADRTEYAGETFQESNWERISTTGWDGAYVNEYFAQHPEMVLGTQKLTRGLYSSNELTVEPFKDKGSLGDQIREAMGKIQGKMEYPAQLSPEKSNFRQATAKKRAQKLQIKDGVIHSRDENGNLTKVETDKDTAARITGMVEIRDAHIALCDAMQQGVKRQEITKLRKALNKAYDSFVEKYGYLNAPKNKKAIREFSDRYAILSLENYSTEGKKITVTKSDVFTKDTIAANRTAESAENVEEGLTISLNSTGAVDVAMIARLTGQDAAGVTRQLIDQRLVFKDKDGNLIPAAQYLSGNVRAKLREMEGLTGIDKDYLNNVEALREVVPPTVQHTDIYVNPGASWVPVQVYEDFVGHILDRYNHVAYRTGKKDFAVEYVPETNEYKVVINDAYAKMSARNTQVWGESGKSFNTIFENMLNGRRTNVYRDRGDGTRELDRAKTEAVAEKVEKLNEEFRKWLWDDETRRTEMQELYNNTYNALVTPKYSGESLTVNGLNSTYTLRPHQKDAVARIINSGGNTLLAHRVGAGKTMEMAAAAMKLKQLGVIKKPMFVVPNNVVAQWGKEFKDYFPAANILVVGDEDMNAAERMTTINRIKNNDYDAVILAYTKFEKIQMTTAWRQKFYEEQIDSIMFAINAEKESQGGKGFTVKQLENKRKQLEARVKKLTDKAKDEDGAMFEDLGVDSLFVDEAHNFKNLEYSTRMSNVSGLGKAEGAQRSFDLYTKIRYLQQLNGGRGVVFATATPVMNSMTEMYIMQKYLQPDLLKQLGIEHFDSWAKMFGEVVNALEIAPSGSGYRLKQTFSKFKNVRALQQLFRSFTDVMTDVPGLKIPKMKGKKVQIVECEQSEFQKNYMAELAQRADNVKNVDPSVDNMLKITSDGRKISYSQRMIDPSLPYEETGKIYKCCDNVWKVYQESSKTKGTQMIFCDMATPKGKSSTKAEPEANADEFAAVDMESAQLYDDMKARLVQLGIPAKEIAFIHDAKNDKQKAELSEKMNNGTIRVLIGSTGKMGVGLNAQKKAVAIHHLDAPWRPGDIEQRDGRVFRQKNENEEAYKFVYVTRGSFDSRLWDILERKQKFINQVMNGEDVGNEIEDTGEVTLSAAEVKAVASDNPLIMEQVALEKEISKLQSLQQAHQAGVSRAHEKMTADRRNIAVLEVLIAAGQKDLQNRKDTYSDDQKFSIQIGKNTFTDKKDAGIALVAAAQAQAVEGEYTNIGQFAGFTLRVLKTREGIKGQITGAGNYEFQTYPGNTTYGINHLIAVVKSIDEKMASWNKNLAETKSDLEMQKQLAAEPFEQAEKLKQKRTRYNEVMDILNPPKEEQSLDTDGGDAVQYQQRNNLDGDNYDLERISEGTRKGDLPGVAGGKGAESGKRYSSKAEATEKWKSLGADKQGQIAELIDLYSYGSEEGALFVGSEPGAADKMAEAFYIAMQGNRVLLENDPRFKWLGDMMSLLVQNVEEIEAGTYSFDFDEEIEYQQRTQALTDREVLQQAADQLAASDLTDGERDALNIFQSRLEKLEQLQDERTKQGELYRQQQFTAPADRKAAQQTKNRMEELDRQIKNAEADVLAVEDKQVLKAVLQKARKVVAKEQWTKDQESLKRWRERRYNADAIKKYRTRLKKDVDEMTNWVLHPNNKDVVKQIPDVLKGAVIPFLSSVDFTSKRQLRGGEATKADQNFMNRLKGLKAALKPDGADPEKLYSDYNDLPPNFMETLETLIESAQAIVDKKTGEFVVNEMTAEELKALSDVVRNLKTFVQNFNRFHYNAMFKHVSEAGNNSISTLSQMKPAEHTGGVSKFLLWDQMRPAYAFERFGEGGVAVYDGLRRGQAQLAFNTKRIVEFAEKAYTSKEVQAWEKEIKTIELEDGSMVRMPVSNIMSVYELMKRPQALGHILGGGIRVATFARDGKKISDGGHKLTVEDLKTITDQLTDRQKEVADNLQKFMQDQGGKWGNYVSVKRFGVELFGEDHYFPINSDGRYLAANADEKPGNASLYALLNMGFTKALTKEANNQIVLYSIFDVFSSHMASMAQYNAFALPVVDAIKWFNYQQKSEPDENGKREVLASVRDLMDKAYGVPEETRPGSGKRGYAQNFVINIIKAFNGTEAQGTAYDSMGMKTLHTYNRAQVAYNFRVVVQQPLAITRSAQLIDYASIMRGMKLQPAAIQKNIEEMRQYSGIAAWKSLGFYDVNISRGLTSLIKHDDTWQDKVIDVGMKGAEIADTMTWAGMWAACKEEVIRKQKLTPKDAGFYEAVTKLFEDVIYKTQVVDSVLTKNEFMRDKGFFARAVGSFMSEPTTTASMVVDAFDKLNRDMQRGMSFQQAWKQNRDNIVRTAYVYGIGAVMLAAVQSIADAWRDDDDYQTFIEKWLEAFGGNAVDELMILNKLPIVSDFYEVAKELLSKMGFDTYGNPPQSVFMQWYDSLVKGTEILYDRITGAETNYTWYGGAYKLLQALSGITGLPMAGATREIVTAWNNTVGAMAPSLKVKTYEPSAKSQIKYAYQDGFLTEEEATAQLLEQNLVDSENEAYFTIRGWDAGDGYSRYDAIYDAVLTDGDFNQAMGELTSHGYTEKDVLSQVKSQIGKWYREGNITKQQATQMLTKYFDLDSKEITATVNKWSSVVVTGIAFNDIKDEFMMGNLTQAKAIDMYVRYGGYEQEKAAKTVKGWQFELTYGFAYEDRVDAYKRGLVSATKLRQALIQYGGMSEEDADNNMRAYEWMKKNPKYDLPVATILQMMEPIEKLGYSLDDVGMDPIAFQDYLELKKKCNGTDSNNDGKADRNSVKRQVIAVIDDLPITAKQKDALYMMNGWSKGGLANTPWH